MHVKKNGKAISVLSSVSNLKDKDGASIGMLAVIRDITERSGWRITQKKHMMKWSRP